VVDGIPAGHFSLVEQFRVDALSVFESLRELGVGYEVISGDPRPVSEPLLQEVPIHSGLSPEEKSARVRASYQAGEKPIVIGDGINDTAAMREATVSLALSDGAELPQDLATGILQGNQLGRLPAAIQLCRQIQKTLRENLLFAAGYNGIGILLAAAGILHPVVAALLMLGSSLFVSVRAAGGISRAERGEAQPPVPIERNSGSEVEVPSAAKL
jgi:P-type E1-E2 ATPase